MLDKFSYKLPFVNWIKGLIFDLTKILLPKCLLLTYSLICKGYALSDTFYRIAPNKHFEVISMYQFLRESNSLWSGDHKRFIMVCLVLKTQ